MEAGDFSKAEFYLKAAIGVNEKVIADGVLM